ncbi:ABC transporter permease [Frankia nepalensis]|uniref:ABC transporter permease n=1 Tax=Frankia nepalensis TaxID=1836974 RepID=UPI0027DBCFE4|nr:ABC transporter permease [Frankia nepalensis]
MARSEWTKIISLRSTVWTLLAAFVMTVGLAVVFAVTLAGRWDDMSPADRADHDLTSLTLLGVNLAQLAIGVLGVLVVSGEYSTGMIRATLSAVPRRLPVLWAKSAVFGLLAFALMLVTALVAFLVGQAILSTKGIDLSLADPGAFRGVVGAAFYVTAIGLLGLGLGALLRSTPGAIAGLFGLVLVIPMVVSFLPDSLDGLERYLPSMAGNAVMRALPDPDVLSPGGGFLTLLLYVAVTLAAAAVGLRRRDA